MQFVDIDRARLAYREEGDPETEPVVLLHGYMGSHRTWRHQTGPLSAGRRVIALDWLGWGRSSRDPALRYDYDTEVDRLRQVLDALGIEACNLFGHDYGGYLALGLALRNPGRVLRLALLNSRAHRTFTPRWALTFALWGFFARRPLLRRVASRLPLEAVHRRSVAREMKRAIFDEAALRDYVGWMSADPQGAPFLLRFHADYRVSPRAELALGLPAVRCPAAVIWGERDIFLPRGIALELARALPSAELSLIEGAGHFVTEERPEEVLAALEKLLARPHAQSERAVADERR